MQHEVAIENKSPDPVRLSDFKRLPCMIAVVGLTILFMSPEFDGTQGNNQGITATGTQLSEGQRGVQIADSRDARVTQPYLLL